MIKLHRTLFLAIATLILSIGYTSAQNKKVIPNLYKNIDQVKMNQWVDSVFNTLTPDQRLGQLITIITLGDAARKSEIVSLVKNQHVGGVIFLKGSPKVQANLTNAAQAEAKVPLMISIDGEWGLSMRLANTTRFPKNMMLGAIQDDSLLYKYGREVARQCREMGIHVNYAPDLDVNSNPDNPVIGIRSYGEDPKLVAKLGIAYSKGLEDGNVMSVAKHFPGHGDTSTDSHHTLPVIESDRDRLDEFELVPFKKYIDAGLSGMMIAHLNIPALDSVKQPSSLSKPIVTDLLQDELGFTGLIFTDGLPMKGVVTEKDHCARALIAGNDILLGPANPVKEFKALQKAVADGMLSEDLVNEKCRKVLAYKYILDVHKTQPIEAEGLIGRLNPKHAEWLNRKLHEKAITLLKNDDKIIPLKKLDERKIAAISIGASISNTFQKTLRKYGKVTCFNVADAAGLDALKTKLSPFTTVIVSVHTPKANADAAISRVCKDKDYILTYFIVPYRMDSYAASSKKADGIVLAYENTELAQEYAAQAIFGGIETEGKIPVSVKGLFKEGDGIETEGKIRLKYSMPEDVGIDSEKLDSIEAVVNEGIAAKAFPGCQILVAKDGVVIYNRSFGSYTYEKRDSVNNESVYDIASMTKGVATVPAVMKLFDKKKISLNTTLSSYVPQLKGTNKASITVRDALLHESRLPSFIPYYLDAIDRTSYPDNKLFNRSQTNIFKAQFDGSTWARTDYKFKPGLVSTEAKDGFVPLAKGLYINKSYNDTIIAAIANSTLIRRKTYRYSCLNFMLLKEAVEDIAETDLNTFLQNNFYKELGMSVTTYNPLTVMNKSDIVPTESDNFLRKQLLQGYVHDEGAAFMGGISGNAGLFSNANDIAKLCQTFLNGGEYGGERYFSEKTSNLFTKTTSGISRRGLGFDKPEPKTNKGNPCSPSTPASVYGHTGFTGTCFWVDPDNNMIYVFLSNRIYPKRTHKALMELSIRPRIQEIIYQAMK